MRDIIENLLVNNTKKSMLESIDGIDDIDFLKKELKEHLRKEFDLQQRIDKATNDLEIIIGIIKEQHTSNDNWILERLESNKSILKGGKYE